MASPKTPKVEVAAVIMACGKKVLAVHNPTWGAFSLPMTKRRRWRDPSIKLGMKLEDAQAAALRAAAEVLGRTLAEAEWPQCLHEVKEYRQNDADGIWKLYNVQVFKMPLTKPPVALGAGVVAEWLTVDQLKERRPVSSTVRYLLAELETADKLPPWSER